MTPSSVIRASAAADLGRTPVQGEESQEQSRQLSQERSLPPGHVPGYEIERLLGEGSFGSVWLARELKTGKQVAIKFYTQRRGLNWSLLCREVEKLAVLYTSRNIVGLLDVGWDHDPPYFVMEYLEAGSLDDRLSNGAIPVDDAVRFATAVARALVHAHRSGILHCDVKPANILLDVNAEPRLGDFGQSRLTTEQSPSLGTLYYMAPEQAVLDGVPDVRWDVYALGALLYHMLTGAPPYSSAAAEAKLRAARTLPERLEAYRQIIRHSPAPDGHRSVPGVDHALADVIDGCLQRDPHQRLPQVQRVLDRLEQREQSRFRRPLVALGFLGPILFLFAMYWIAESAVPRIVAAAEQNLIDRALASDGVSARILAESVQQELRSREAGLMRLAEEPQLRALIERSRELTNERLLALSEGTATASDDETAPFNWMREATQSAERQLSADGRTADDSWFVTDDRGRQVFRAPAYEPDRETTIGKPFHWRDYFHGLGSELDPATSIERTPPRTQTGISTAFRSQATGDYMVAIAAPIHDPADQKIVGVLARTIRLTALLQQWEIRLQDPQLSRPADGSSDTVRFLALADTRGGPMRLLDHPGLSSLRLAGRSEQELDAVLKIDPATADLLQTRFQMDHFRDPVGAELEEYAGEWLAAAAPVGQTGWLAIVQERRDHTVQPVDNLRRVFQRAGFWSLGTFAALLLLMWYLIHRASG
jgi:hypothetical protein